MNTADDETRVAVIASSFAVCMQVQKITGQPSGYMQQFMLLGLMKYDILFSAFV